MSNRWKALIVVLSVAIAVTVSSAAIPQRNSDGSVKAPISLSYHVRFTPPNPDWQHEAWREAITTINGVPGSQLEIIEDAITPTPTAPVLGDGINSLAVMTTTGWDFYNPEMPFVLACLGNECDVWFNNVDFNIVGGTGSYAYARYYDAESLALSALLMMAARLDNDIRYERIVYSHPPYGIGRRQLTLDEATWLQTVFGATPPAQSISGTVKRGSTPIIFAYVCAALIGGGDDICVTTDTSGAYTVRLPQAGMYRIVASPLTTNRSYLFSPAYYNNNPANVDFLSIAYASTISVAAGQNVTGVTFDVSAVAAASEPSEALEPIAIATDGTPITFNAWPCANEDAAAFNSVAGACYAIGSRATGIAGQATALRLERSETTIALKAGATVIAQNTSRDNLDNDPRSLLVFCETTPRTLTVSIQERQSDACGAGYYYDTFVKALAPSTLTISSISPSLGVAGTAAVFVVFGTGILPGAQVTIGGQVTTLNAVDGCNASFNCTMVSGVAPASLGAGTYDVSITNPNAQTATLSQAFKVDPVPNGSVYDMYYNDTYPFPTLLMYGDGMCWGDIDNDGDEDVFRASYDDYHLLRNNRSETGSFSFTNISGSSSGISGYDYYNPMYSCTWGDVDNDSDLDLVVTFRSEAQQDSIRLYVNQLKEAGSISFQESASIRGITLASNDIFARPLFLDYNNDGWLDLFIANGTPASGSPYLPNRLYKNLGGGYFVDDPGAGLAMGTSNHRTIDVIEGDFNDDRWPDLVLINGQVIGGHDGHSMLFVNNQDGTFTDKTSDANVDINLVCNNGQAADFNNDGKLDFACFYSTTTTSTPPRLYLNDGTGSSAHFQDIAGTAGFTSATLPPRNCPTMTILDVDLDGDDDLYLGCRYSSTTNDRLSLLLSNDFVESGSVTLTNTTTSSGLSSQYNYDYDADVAVAVDWDGDFAYDIFKTGHSSYDLVWGGLQNTPDYPTSLYWNFTKDSLKVKLDGVVSNPHGIGARIRAIRSLGVEATITNCRTVAPAAEEQRIRQMLSDGTNQQPYLVQVNWNRPLSPPYAAHVDCLDITWPSGLRQTLTSLPMHTNIVVKEATSLQVLSVEPNSGPVTGDTHVTIRGFGFQQGAHVYFGGVPAPDPITVATDGTTITCNTPSNPPGLVDVKVANSDYSDSTLFDGYRYVAVAGTIDVRDPNPDMRDGTEVSNNNEILGSTTRGRAINAVATDGVTRVLFRVTVPGSGNVTFSIRDEADGVVNIGGMRLPGTTGSATTLVAPAQPLGDGRYMAFAIYQPPQSFIRTSADNNLTDRLVNIAATYDTDTYAATLKLVRPAVTLLHGLWSRADTWSWALQTDPRWTVNAFDYAMTSDRWFDTNRMVPYFAVQRTLELQRSKGVAITQVSMIGHSMGGLLSRLFASNTRAKYIRDDNYGAGDFYELFTLDSPHIGSPLADLLVSLRGKAVIGPMVADQFANHNKCITCGAIDDLRPSSTEITSLPAITLPVHALYAVGGSDMISMVTDRIAASDYESAVVLRLLAGFGNSPEDAFFGEPHDLIVGQTSQLGRLTGTQTSPFHYVDATNRAIHTSVCGDPNPNSRAIELLNTPISTAATFASGFPAASGFTEAAYSASAEPSLTMSDTYPMLEGDVPHEQVSFADGITLTIAKNESNAMLTWSGTAAPYRVLKSLTATFAAAVYCTMVTAANYADVDALTSAARYHYLVDTVSDPSCTTDTTTTTVSSVSPSSGSTIGDMVYVVGQNFQPAATVYFDTVAATDVVVMDRNYIRCRAPAHAAGTVNVTVKNSSTDTATRTNAYVYVDTVGALTITEPAAGALVRQGQQVIVSVSTSGFTPVRMLISPISAMPAVLTKSPWSATIAVSQNAIGPYEISVIAFDAEDNVRQATVTVNVGPAAATLERIAASPNPVLLFSFMLSSALRVTGHYSDNVDRDITSPATGTTYRSEDPTVAVVETSGLVAGIKPGRTNVVITNNYIQAVVPVYVKSLPMIISMVGKTTTTISWPALPGATGYDLVRGDLGSLRSSAGNFTAATQSCLAPNTSSTFFNDTASPGPGQAYWYLVRSRLPAAQSYDEWADWPDNKQSGSRDAEIGASANACP